MAAPQGNLYALGNTGGRPPLFETPEKLQEQVNAFFTHCIENSVKRTITGLALYLGFESRQSLYDYEKHEEFSYILKRAKLVVENSYETNGQTIDIFALKNMGWKDSQEITHNLPKGIMNIDPLNDSADNSPAQDSPA